MRNSGTYLSGAINDMGKVEKHSSLFAARVIDEQENFNRIKPDINIVALFASTQMLCAISWSNSQRPVL
jgi:hypothetical protein